MKMTDEQKLLFDGLTELQKEIVTAKISDPHLPDIDVYKHAKIMMGQTFGNDRSCSATISEILSRPNIQDFLRTFEIDMSGINHAIMKREEILEDLTMIAESSIFDVCDIMFADKQFMDVETGEIFEGVEKINIKRISDIDPKYRKLIKKIKQTKYGFEVELHDAMVARKMLNEMQGFNAPTESNITIDGPKTLDDFYGES